MSRPVDAEYKWLKEVLGIPTYLGATLLGLSLPNGNTMLAFLLIIPSAIIYNAAWKEMLQIRSKDKSPSLFINIFIGQVLICGGLIGIARIFR